MSRCAPASQNDHCSSRVLARPHRARVVVARGAHPGPWKGQSPPIDEQHRASLFVSLLWTGFADQLVGERRLRWLRPLFLRIPSTQLRTRPRAPARRAQRRPRGSGSGVPWHPEPPPEAERFLLTSAQLVLAHEHGFASWTRLRRYVEVVTFRAWTPGRPAPAEEPLADRFLRSACLTYSDDEPADRVGAAQLLEEHPELPRNNLFVAAACADVASVRRHLDGGKRGPR